MPKRETIIAIAAIVTGTTVIANAGNGTTITGAAMRTRITLMPGPAMTGMDIGLIPTVTMSTGTVITWIVIAGK